MSGTAQNPNLTQLVVALQELVKASYLTEQQIEALIGKLALAGTVAGPISASAGTSAGYAYVTVNGSTYKIQVFNP